MVRKVYYLFLLLPLALLVLLIGGSKRREVPKEYLPWVEEGLVVKQRYGAENLYEYIDGAQDRYVEAGCQSLTLWEREKQGHRLLLEVYTFDNEAKAQGILDKEGGKYQDNSTLILRWKHYLLKLSITPPWEEEIQRWEKILQGERT